MMDDCKSDLNKLYFIKELIGDQMKIMLFTPSLIFSQKSVRHRFIIGVTLILRYMDFSLLCY